MQFEEWHLPSQPEVDKKLDQDNSFTAKGAKDAEEQVQLYRQGRQGRKEISFKNQGREDNAK